MKLNNTFIHLLATLFAFLCTTFIIVLAYFYPNETFIGVLKYILLFNTLFVLWSATRFVSLANIYVIFIGMNIVFLFNRVFLDIFNLYDFSKTVFLQHITLSDNAQISLLSIFSLSLLLIHFGFLLFINSKRRENVSLMSYHPFLFKFGLLFFLVSLPLLLFKLSLKIHILIEYGYAAMNTIGLDFNYPWYTKGMESFFLIGFSLILASMPPKKYILWTLGIFLFVGFIMALTGIRAFFVVKIVFVYWYYYEFYSQKKPKLSLIIMLIMLVVLFAQIMGAYRSGEKSLSDNILLRFAAQQGTSLTVLGFMLHYDDDFKRNGYPYILHPLVATVISNQGQNQRYVEKYNMLSRDLTYYLNDTAYLSGAGLGSSYIAELYDLGYGNMFIILILLGAFLGKITSLIQQHRIWLFMSPMIISHIIYMSRTNFFPRFREIILYLFIYLTLLMIYKLSKKGGHNA